MSVYRHPAGRCWHTDTISDVLWISHLDLCILSFHIFRHLSCNEWKTFRILHIFIQATNCKSFKRFRIWNFPIPAATLVFHYRPGNDEEEVAFMNEADAKHNALEITIYVLVMLLNDKARNITIRQAGQSLRCWGV